MTARNQREEENADGHPSMCCGQCAQQIAAAESRAATARAEALEEAAKVVEDLEPIATWPIPVITTSELAKAIRALIPTKETP